MQQVKDLVEKFREELNKVVFGQAEPIELMLCALLSEGHVLIEGVPGTAKTLLVRTMAHVLDGRFKRVQFTPDLLPADIIGTNVFDLKSSEFRFHPGPIFTNFLLADEINRAPAKTQAALLEAMQERQVTVDGENRETGSPFIVFATQNPIEQEGTYPLPEAELDRFMFKVIVDYPDEASEIRMLEEHHDFLSVSDLGRFSLNQVADIAALQQAKGCVRKTIVRPEVVGYVNRLIRATRNHVEILLGASPRAGVTLLAAAKTMAAFEGREYILPDDIKKIFCPVLRHRIILRPTADLEQRSADRILSELLAGAEVPR